MYCIYHFQIDPLTFFWQIFPYFSQYCLVAFLILVEAKLKTWAVKYGKEQEVQQILTEYRSFVGTRNIFQEFDRAFHEMQQVSEAYKKDTELS